MMKRNLHTLLAMLLLSGGVLAGNYHKVARMQLKNSAVLLTEDTLYWGVGTTGSGSTPIRAAEQTLSCGSAIADIRPLTYEDGSPLIENNRLYYSVSSRTGGAGPAILELDLGTCELKMTGVLRTSYQHQMWQGMAAHIMYDRTSGLWQVTIPLHKTDPATGKWTHLLAVKKSVSDLRHGATRLDFELLDYEKPTVGDEDAQIFYDKGMKRWVMIYASTRQPDDTKGGYILRLQTSKRPDGGFRDYSFATNVSSTGVTSTFVGGKRYVFSGDVQSDGHNNYPVFSFPDLMKVGQLNLDVTDGGTRGWNNVTPFPEGLDTRYVFLAFDRGVTTDENVWTYGRLHLYYSRECNPGLEFPVRHGDVTLPSSVQQKYDPTQLHFMRYATWNNLFTHDIRMGVLDLSDQVLGVRNSNMYPAFGDVALRQDGESIYPVATGNAGVVCGLHLPLSNYIIDLADIREGDARYLYLGDREGTAFMKVSFTRNGDDLIVCHVDDGGVATEIGRTAASDTEARIFVTPESLLYVYTRGSTFNVDATQKQ